MLAYLMDLRHGIRLSLAAAACALVCSCSMGGLENLSSPAAGGAGGSAGGGAAAGGDAALPDASPGGASDGGPDATRDSGSADTGSAGAAGDAASTCTQSTVGWFTTQADFEAAVSGPTTTSFSLRGDGTTIPTAGMAVPVDEYLGCCGFSSAYAGDATNGSIIWAGNPTAGFELRAMCGNGGGLGCMSSAHNGIRFTFKTPMGAVGGHYAGGTTMQVYGVDGSLLDQLTLSGSGMNFVGHASKTPIGSVVFTDPVGENVSDIEYAPCK